MQKIEKYEWSEFWFDTLADTKGKRTLLIGDSITGGIKNPLKQIFGESVYLDRYGTSRAVDSGIYMTELLHVLSMAKYDVIFFNNGLHGGHMTGEIYKDGCDKALGIIKEKCPDTKIIAGLTTPLNVPVKEGVCYDEPRRHAEGNSMVLERNRIMTELAEKYKLDICDSYACAENFPETCADDGVHFKPAGYELLAGLIAEHIRKYI